MLGAIIGDIAGSRFEFDNIKSKDFDLLNVMCDFTDDTVMTVAIAKALLQCNHGLRLWLDEITVRTMQTFGRKYPHRGYGGHFGKWLMSDHPQPYNSYGNGAAMRISPVGFFAQSEAEVRNLSRIVTCTTHNHPEGVKGAEAVAMAIYWARQGMDKKEIFARLSENYYPELKTPELSYDNLLKNYGWHYGSGSVSCQSSVPQALACFNESTDFEDAIRTAISIGGDSDTIAAMVGGIAEAYYGIPNDIANRAKTFLPNEFIRIINDFNENFITRCIQGFDPYVNDDSEILILGSFSSRQSREQGFYYGNRLNRFWGILAESFGAPVPKSIADKKALLRTGKIALWDVVRSCDCNGESREIADIAALVKSYPIRKIITNGARAKELFIEHFPQLESMCIFLPSTSPANVRFDKSVWVNALTKS